MPGGMEANPHVTKNEYLAIGMGLDIMLAKTFFQNTLASECAMIQPRPSACMIGMRMGDKRAINWAPWVNVCFELWGNTVPLVFL